MPKKKVSTKAVSKSKSKASLKNVESKPIRKRIESKPLPKRKPRKLKPPLIEAALELAARFDAATNGFAFINSWSFTDDETAKVHQVLLDSVDRVLSVDPLIGQVLGLIGVRSKIVALVTNAIPQVYGLCGGMAFSALDYYNAGLPIPPGSAQPTYDDPNGKRLREYLVRRQLDSLTLNLPQILLWIAVLHLVPPSPLFKSGAPWMLEQTKEQWKTLKKNLDNQQPTPLALIGTNPDPSENHQVLAYDYQEFTEGKVPKVRLFVYDMNCPGAAQTIELDFSGAGLAAQESCGSSARGPLQGFICEHYSHSKPPALSGFG